MSVTVITECISWLIKVTDNNVAQWKPEIYVAYISKKQDRQCMYNVTLSRVHATTVAVDKQ
jgi:hypothetical protein